MDTSYYSDSSASPAGRFPSGGGGGGDGSGSSGFGSGYDSATLRAHSGSLQSGLSTISSNMSISSSATQGGGGTLRRGTLSKSKSGFRLSSLSFNRSHKSADRCTDDRGKEDSVRIVGRRCMYFGIFRRRALLLRRAGIASVKPPCFFNFFMLLIHVFN